MRHFLGPFAFLYSLPVFLIPSRFTRTRVVAAFLWRFVLLACIVILGALDLYFTFFEGY